MNTDQLADQAPISLPTSSELALAPMARPHKWETVKRFKRKKLAVAGLIVIVLLYSVALLAPWLMRYPDDQIHSGVRNTSPSAYFWLGTDRNGREVFSRLVMGARI